MPVIGGKSFSVLRCTFLFRPVIRVAAAALGMNILLSITTIRAGPRWAWAVDPTDVTHFRGA